MEYLDMNMRAGNHTLAEFRAKTDQQLHILISSRLDRGLSFARLLLDENTRESWTSTDNFSALAESAYTEVSRLLPLLRGVTAAERRRLESRLIQLREVLDCVSLRAVPRVRSACS
jgi:hypothetical protein